MSAEDDDLAATYSLIHSFLTERSHFKAAEAVKKAVKGVIVIQSGDQDGPTLPTILSQWKKLTADQKGATAPGESAHSESSSSDSNSDSSEDSESSSEESSSESDADTDQNLRKPKGKKRSGEVSVSSPPKKTVTPRPKASVKSKAKSLVPKASPPSANPEVESSSSSESESSDSDNSEVEEGGPDRTTKDIKFEKLTTTVTPKPKPGGSSDSDSSSSESEDDSPTPIAAAVEGNRTPVTAPRSPAGSSQTLPSVKGSYSSDSDSTSSGSSSASDSDSDDDTSSDDTPEAGKKPGRTNNKLQKAKVVHAANAPAIDSPIKTDRPTAVTKKRRTDEAGSSVATSVMHQPEPTNTHQKGNSKGQPRKNNTPFSRVKVDEIKFADERLKDNSFGSRKATVNDYGAKASADLIVTRGAGFRKEKGKKKRGSYRGGDITMESHSIKFTD